MSDTQEIASTVTETASPTKAPVSAAVAEVLRRHPSKPAPAASPLLRSALAFDDCSSSPDAPDSDPHGTSYDEMPDTGDAMAPARGIAIGLALMVPFWGAVGLILRAALR